jgi:hypothetical protein
MSMKLSLRIGWALALIGALCLTCLAVAAVGDQPAGTQQACGPCCPLAHGTPPKAISGVGSLGPRHTCRRLPSFSLAYEGKTYPVGAVEAADIVLVPERTLGVTGAVVEWQGERKSTIALGTKTLHLTLGSRTVTVEEGDQSTEATWTLCPRLLGGITYVPLRSAAEALGLSVAWKNGTVTLDQGQPVAGGTAASCPASRVEEALGVTVVRGPVSGPLGSGVGVVTVADGGRGAELGLQPKDVIVMCNGKPTTCPLDLDGIITTIKSSNQCVCCLEVVRNGEKVKLQKPPTSPQ